MINYESYPHQPHTLEACKECRGISRENLDCYPSPKMCADFNEANEDYEIELRRKAREERKRGTTC